MTRYRNPWYTHSGSYGPEYYETDAKPRHYRGFEIYKRFDRHYDIVKDGMCVTQRCGWSKQLIDDIIAGKIDVTWEPCDPIGRK